jgi:hypothetical protein
MYKDHDVQPWPIGMNYMDEQFRFGQVARQWNLIHPRGSEEWNALLEEFLKLDYFINPTMTIYSAGRDVMRARNADWHQKYTLPSLQDFSILAGKITEPTGTIGRRRMRWPGKILPGVDVVPE